jgi:thioredoxin-like negative regulator of GroEL
MPSEAEVDAKEAADELAAGDLGEAEQGFREALDKEPNNKDAALGLAKILLERGAIDEARPLIMPHLPDPEAEHLHARIEVAEWATLPADGRLGAARQAAARGDWRAAFEGMIASLADERDDARQALVTSFAALGDEDPLVPEYRRRLAAALY